MATNQNFNVSGQHVFEKQVDYGDLSKAVSRVHVLLSPAEAATLRDAGTWSASLETRLDNAAKGQQAPLSGEAAFFA